ncbi:MAG: S-methyl-5-thioribose-1-phosphate isomerase [Lachnospiraceae bacterium]|nr:S-methyl-5-thioribose-1-phosphate isomerase [Lachnospiraceae bacterium]
MKYLDNDPVKLNGPKDAVVIIDQTRLPKETVFLELKKLEEMYDAIKTLSVRGAPCIGVFAGYCMAVLSLEQRGADHDGFIKAMKENADRLNLSRPTAVNLSWALSRQIRKIESMTDSGPEDMSRALFEEAERIHEEDIRMCLSISENGLSLLKNGDGLLTHCNAGALATTRYGTGLGPILLGKERGYEFRVYSDETRPLLQGARLTAYELAKAGVDVTVICDNMANICMSEGRIDAVLVGCDRVASNGDTANKIGTSGLAVLAKHHGIPFYVLGPYSTIDMNCDSGKDIKIEQRDPEEISTMWYEKPLTVEGAKYYNPAFDVTDHDLITAIITDKGILYPPFKDSIKKVMS